MLFVSTFQVKADVFSVEKRKRSNWLVALTLEMFERKKKTWSWKRRLDRKEHLLNRTLDQDDWLDQKCCLSVYEKFITIWFQRIEKRSN